MMERTHVGSGRTSFVELESWIESARQGDREALGLALSSVRDYLLLIANDELDPGLQLRENASDLVQQTCLTAQRSLEGFRGRTASEWRHWLRKILLRNLAQQRRRCRSTARRQAQLVVRISDEIRRKAASDTDNPIRDLALREREAALNEALQRLPDHYRQVVIWHHRAQLSFEEIGLRCGITSEAARKLWMRALVRLRKELGPAHDSR